MKPAIPEISISIPANFGLLFDIDAPIIPKMLKSKAAIASPVI